MGVDGLDGGNGIDAAWDTSDGMVGRDEVGRGARDVVVEDVTDDLGVDVGVTCDDVVDRGVVFSVEGGVDGGAAAGTAVFAAERGVLLSEGCG